RVRVAARVDRLGAVQPDVDEVRGDLLRVRVQPGCIREDERGAVLAQQLRELGAEEARMTHLERVADRAVAVGAGPGAAVEPMVVTAREARRGGGGAGQQREE